MKIFWENDDWLGAIIQPSVTGFSWIPNAKKPSCGLLASGSESGTVGVTVTDLHYEKEDLKRCNFNLRGHHSSISLVRWNLEHTKLASCDQSGVIYVWIPNDERWSVELINDRGIKVRDLCWSPSGSLALICYEDNFILIGTSSGQRIWSNSLDMVVTCGVWSADSREIILGFSNGGLRILTGEGFTIIDRAFPEYPVKHLAASCLRPDGKWTLAVQTSLNKILFINSYTEVDPICWKSRESILEMQWNSCGTFLAVVTKPSNLVVLDYQGHAIYADKIPVNSTRKISAFTWAYGDKVVIAAAGGHIAIGRVVTGVPSLSVLATYNMWLLLGCSAQDVDSLPLPMRERFEIRSLDKHIIRCRVPLKEGVIQQVCEPSDWRWYCTVRPMSQREHTYALCIEHMGGLIPILVGRQTNRIIPQFHISLFTSYNTPKRSTGMRCSTQVEDVGAFNRSTTQRNSVWRRSKKHFRALMNRHVARSVDCKPNCKLVQVTSNVWCTRFKITSLSAQHLPSYLAQVVYKTSVLHLQPRQMTVNLVNLSNRKKHFATNTTFSNRFERPVNSSTTNPAHCSHIENNTRFMIVAPSNGGVIALHTRLRNHVRNDVVIDDDPSLLDEGTDELSDEENVLYQTVLNEFNDLRTAIEQHIQKMKRFASDLQKSSLKFELFGNGDGDVATTDKASSATVLNRATNNSVQKVEVALVSSSTSHWPHLYDEFEYIDEDEVTENRKPSNSSPFVKKFCSEGEIKEKCSLSDITSVLDKLSKLANELTARCAVSQIEDISRNSQNTMESSKSDNTVSRIRFQLKDIARRVAQIERKVNYGDELLDVMCGDLQQRIVNIKKILGEQKAVSDEACLLTMQNKAPFWNEASQVYQLDFGGRVTQESAKNFQIEFDDKQVMQFGRIENGAYTLDFRAPFCAVQAFAIALASITQRLK